MMKKLAKLLTEEAVHNSWKVKKEKLSDGSFVFNVTNGAVLIHASSEDGAAQLMALLNKHSLD